MPPVLTAALILCGALLLLLLILTLVLFLGACRPQRGRGDDAFARHTAKKAGEEKAQLMLSACRAMAALPGETLTVSGSDGAVLRGRYLPCGRGGGRVALLCHGWNSSPAYDFAPLVPMYHSLGFDVLAIEQRAQNGSGGRYMTFGVLESDDIRVWCERLAARGAAQILLCGISMGAASVLLALRRPLPRQVAGAVADCGYDSAENEVLSIGRRNHLPARLLLPFMDIWARLLGHFSFYDADAASALAESTLPVLLIHGTADRFVPCDCARRLAEKRDCETLFVEGAPHALACLFDPDGYKAAVAAFITRHFAPISDKE